MKEDIKYPYIGRNSSNVDFLICGGEVSFVVSKANHGKMFEMTSELESLTENITRGYLSNTYGKVESKEHAEFIMALGEAAGFKFSGGMVNFPSFAFYESGRFYFHKGQPDELSTASMKQVAIPLPPKQEISLRNVGSGGQGGGVTYGGDSSNTESNSKADDSDDWPKVGDDVAWSPKLSRKGTLLNIYEGMAWVKDSYGEFVSIEVNKLKKPKTQQEELRDSLINTYNESLDAGHFVDSFLSKFEVKKKPQ